MDPVTTPNPPPEGEALERARQRARLSQREAARRSDISETRWRQITKGHHIAGGVAVPDFGPAETIARMAYAVRLTPEDLDNAERYDAASYLRFLYDVEESQAAPTPTTDLANVPDEDLLAELGRRLRSTRGNTAPTIRADLNYPRSASPLPSDLGLAARHGEKDD